jgi:ribosomal protein S8
MVTDPIADFLTRVRNAQMAGHRIVEIPASNLKKRITEILYNQGYILKYKFEDDSKQGVIKIALSMMLLQSNLLFKVWKGSAARVCVRMQSQMNFAV